MGWLKFSEKYIRDFSNPKALGGWLAILILFFSSTNGFFLTFAPEGLLRWIYAGIASVLVVCWFWNHFHLPRRVKSKVNIVVAIATEEIKGDILKKDLIKKLEKDLEQGGLGDLVHVIDLRNHFSQKIKNRVDIEQMNKNVRAHFWIWGTARQRNEMTYLDLEGWVYHGPISVKRSGQFGKEFRSALPSRIEFHDDLSFHFSELSADMIYFSARYITGVAALLSGDPDMALRLHTSLGEEIERAPHPLLPNLKLISERLPTTISDSHVTKATFYYRKEEYKEMDEEIKAAQKVNPKSYSALLLKSIVEFSVKQNAEAALITTQQAERVARKDITWRYNKTFLLLWLKKYDEGLKLCKSIARHHYPDEEAIIRDVESFCEDLIQKGREHPEVYFWLGHLCYYKKKNLPMALEYYEKFLQRMDATMYPLCKQAQKCLEEIKRDMRLQEAAT